MSKIKNKSMREWTTLCLRIGALSFGGAGRATLYRDALVHEKKWFTQDEFQEIYTIASVLPGPNIVNFAAYVGYKLFGVIGAFGGVAGLIGPGMILALIILWFVPVQNSNIARIFQGFAIGSVAIIFVFIFQLISGLNTTHLKTKIRSIKLCLRLLITVFVIGISIFNFPFFPILFLGIFFGLLVEFFI